MDGIIIVLKLISFFFLSSMALAVPPNKFPLTSGVLKSSAGIVSGSATTSDLSEGSNLYYTTSRVNTVIGTKTTSDISEGSNLYYTDARVKTAAKNGRSGQAFYVSQDIGNDANDCSVLKPCASIQAGVTAANAVAAYYQQAVVYVFPSNSTTGYQENVTLSQQGVNLECVNSVQNSRACYLKGILTVNLTGTSGGAKFIAASNEVYITGFVISQNSSSATISFSGTTFQRLALVNCYIDQNGTGSTVDVTNSGVNGVASTITAFDTTFSNSNASSPTINLTNGRFWTYGTSSSISNGNASGHSLDQSGTTSFIANITQMTGQANITSNTASATFNLTTIASGSNSCIATPSSPNTGLITIAYFGCTSTNTNSVTGSGVVFTSPGNVRLSSSGDIVSTVTQAVVPGLPQGELMLGAGATTGTNVLLSIKGGHVKNTQTTAPTATVNANAGLGATCTLSNASDAAGVINLTTGSASFSSGTQCTITFNKAYGAAPICIFSPNNGNSAIDFVLRGVNMTTTTTTLLVAFNSADLAGTAYKWSYMCMETQ